MFEDEDWNINEDDLKDFNSDDIFKDSNDKAHTPSSAKDAEAKKETALNTSEFKCNVSDHFQNNAILRLNESASQKKVLLDIFKNSSSSQGVLRNDQETSSNLGNKETVECTSNETNECGKNLILNVFQEGAGKPKPIVKSVLKISDHENKFKRKKNVAFSESPGDNNAAKKLCTGKTNKSQEAIQNDLHTEQENEIASSELSRGDASSSKKPMVDLSKSSVHKIVKVPRVKQAITRMFPGPAGILPDDVSETDVIDLDSLDENKNNKSNQYADICSQNTKNLFTTGAWQLMMDDLPADFELYDIATIKENALEYSKTYKKVPYLAGVVQYIDYKPNDPHIILKDLSGRVDARIHHSICKLYPNALGTSVVMLVKDVGLIVTSKKFVFVIISLDNLVSIYSDDMRLVETSHLKTLLKDDNTNRSLHESQISVLDEAQCHDNNEMCKTHLQEMKNNLQQQPGSILKDKCNAEKVKENNCKGILESKIIRKDADECKNYKTRNEPETTDDNCDINEFKFDEDDSWLGVNIDELNSFKAHQFPSSTPLDTHDDNSNGVSFQIRKKSKTVDSKELQHPQQSGKIIPVTKRPSSTNGNRKSIADKLLAFRNPNDISRQPTISKQINLKENTSSIANKPFECEDNDTDDEMLSQLDVDAIAATYSTQNC